MKKKEDNADLKSQSLEDLRSIRKTCDRMMELIQDMMNYSSVEIKKLEKNNIDLEYLVAQCFEEQMKAYKDRTLDLEILPLPQKTADIFLLKILITNILSNSIKFTREKESARIRVFSKRKEGEIHLYFRDNGMGFDMNYAAHIFEPFSRLENKEKYEGNGVGLATVKKYADVYRDGLIFRLFREKAVK